MTRVSQAEADAIRQSARDGAPDRYLAALLATRAARDDLITLAAFSAEIGRIGRHVQEAHLGEIRIQWWRDALNSSAPDSKSGHPVADAFASVIARHELSQSALDDFFDASAHALFPNPPDDDAQLALSIRMTEGTLFTFAATILGLRDTAADAGLIDHAAQAYGRAQLALDLPYVLAANRLPVPLSAISNAEDPDWRAVIASLAATSGSHLAHVRSAYSTAPTPVKSALMPVALVEPYLRVVSRANHDPARDIAGVTPLTRTWRLATCHAFGWI
ncbi:MAG: squalene/phytoene synthase family protein [Hyphomicrobium sp.]|nr:squalene/phytoene synthase family protein [Hyphomicrobium sp.]